jgi:ketosteroid isomerase-like protein
VIAGNDQAEIAALAWRFSDAINRYDTDAFVSLWSEDGTWSAEAPVEFEAQGHAALIRQWRSLMGQWRFFHHAASPGPASVSGSRATARSYVEERGISLAGATLQNLGYYDDEFIRTAAGWRIFRRQFRFLYVSAPAMKPQVLRAFESEGGTRLIINA